MSRHRVDPLSLVAGLFFVSVAALHLSGGLDPELLRLRWLGAAALIVGGLALMLRPRTRAEDDSALDEPEL
jgi:hypothetical protein